MTAGSTDIPKKTAAKSTPAGMKAAAKVVPNSAAGSDTAPTTPETTRASLTKAKQGQSNEATTPSPATASQPTPEQSTGGEAKTPSESAPRKRRVVKRVVRVYKKTLGSGKAPATAKVISEQTPKMEEAAKSAVEEIAEEESVETKEFDGPKKEETAAENVRQTTEMEQPKIEVELMKAEAEQPVFAVVAESTKTRQSGMEAEETVFKSAKDKSVVGVVGESAREGQIMVEVDVRPNEISKSSKDENPVCASKAEEVEDGAKDAETKYVDDKEEPKVETVNAEGIRKDELRGEHAQSEQVDYGADDGYEYGDRVDFEDNGEDDYVEEDLEEPAEEAETLEEERKELTAVAKDRKNKKEYEIFVGGLDRDATEEDVKKVFENVGKVVEVRLHRNLSTNKNKGYAFVKFGNKEHAKRALSEMKNPVIHGKRCGTAPSEDNDTLFLGNICNTWTKEAIRQKLRDYGVEGVENITLVPDVQHEGRSRGFAFLEFSCHAEAMLAYKRLQRPDVVFGHTERTAKVAFAEPIRDPDPEIMAQVKTVFLDGLPPHWDEDRVRECIKDYGEVVRIVLARNMSTAKRKDFGFADFLTHEAAVKCIQGINNAELTDGNSKARVKARLSNPLPKTQAVKGGMRGGFLIGHAVSGTFSRFGRPFGRGGRHFNWANFQRGRGFYPQGRDHTSRMDLEYGYNDRYAPFHRRHFDGQGGRRGPVRGDYHAAAGPSGSTFNRPWRNPPERSHRDYIPSRRQPFYREETFDRRFVGRHFDDSYFYHDGAHGMKRPLYMNDHDADYTEPSRHRPRINYGDPAVSFRGTRYHDNFGEGSDHYSRDYYGPDYGTYPPYHGSDHSYGGGYYY